MTARGTRSASSKRFERWSDRVRVEIEHSKDLFNYRTFVEFFNDDNESKWRPYGEGTIYAPEFHGNNSAAVIDAVAKDAIEKAGVGGFAGNKVTRKHDTGARFNAANRAAGKRVGKHADSKRTRTWIVVDSQQNVHGEFPSRAAAERFYNAWYGLKRKGESFDEWHARQGAFLMITARF